MAAERRNPIDTSARKALEKIGDVVETVGITFDLIFRPRRGNQRMQQKFSEARVLISETANLLQERANQLGDEQFAQGIAVKLNQGRETAGLPMQDVPGRTPTPETPRN